MIVSKVLLRDLISNHIQQENGLNEVLQMTLNAMMTHERTAHLETAEGNKANGYRPGQIHDPSPPDYSRHNTRDSRCSAQESAYLRGLSVFI